MYIYIYVYITISRVLVHVCTTFYTALGTQLCRMGHLYESAKPRSETSVCLRKNVDTSRSTIYTYMNSICIHILIYILYIYIL